jgi:hypothetical protein
MDVKITNFCSGELCKFCHEMSGPDGAHADLSRLLEILSPLPAGVELAIGGGNVLSHPGLIPFLRTAKDNGWIANATINEKHLYNYQELIQSILIKDLIKGLGISYSSERYLNDIKPLLALTDNIVFHLIMGINPVQDVEKLQKFCEAEGKSCKVLVLGYKTFGRGVDYIKNNNVEDNKYQWYTQLAGHFHETKKYPTIFSFDNLAIGQMNLKRFFMDDAWEQFYMGHEGKFSMYIDAVKQQYAVSSTSTDRVSFNDIRLFDYFKKISS